MRTGIVGGLRALAESDKFARQFQRERRSGQRATREIPHRQIRLTPDEPHSQAARGRNVALRRAAETVRSTGEQPNDSLAESYFSNVFPVSFFLSQGEAIDVDIDEILDMDTDDIRISHLKVSASTKRLRQQSIDSVLQFKSNYVEMLLAHWKYSITRSLSAEVIVCFPLESITFNFHVPNFNLFLPFSAAIT